MAREWSQREVEATVSDYLAMLDCELRGVQCNKTEHRRHLATLLDARTDTAIERKRQNISAILIELGFPYIPGYKPLRNYQQLLYEVVAGRIDASADLVSLVASHVESPASAPTPEDILGALVSPPTRPPDERRYPSRIREAPNLRLGTNYLEIEARNRSLGAAGEDFVVHYEVARLEKRGLGRLAARVERISETRGDGAGFDVLSFEDGGDERLIEVKTTAYGLATPFFVTRNELTVSLRRADRYFLYRVFAFRRNPRLFAVPGSLNSSFGLDPCQYIAHVA